MVGAPNRLRFPRPVERADRPATHFRSWPLTGHFAETILRAACHNCLINLGNVPDFGFVPIGGWALAGFRAYWPVLNTTVADFTELCSCLTASILTQVPNMLSRIAHCCTLGPWDLHSWGLFLSPHSDSTSASFAPCRQRGKSTASSWRPSKNERPSAESRPPTPGAQPRRNSGCWPVSMSVAVLNLRVAVLKGGQF